jgi:hypothetical protein
MTLDPSPRCRHCGKTKDEHQPLKTYPNAKRWCSSYEWDSYFYEP